MIGPPDLVASLQRLGAAEFSGLRLRALPYRSEAEASELVRTAGDTVDTWLFTGVVPFTQAWRAGVLDRPASYVRYRGTSLPRMLGQLLAGQPLPGSISIDTLPRQQVRRLLRRGGLPGELIKICEHRADRGSEQFVRFHRRAARQRGGSIAITCVRSVYQELAPVQPTVRLVPATASLRAALRAVSPPDRLAGAGGIAIGVLDLSDPAAELPGAAAELAATVVPLAASRYLLISTPERLIAATGQLRRPPLLGRLSAGRVWGHLGLGVAQTALDAERRARRAVVRARSIGTFAAVLALDEDAELVLGGAPGPRPELPAVPLATVQRRTGIPTDALDRLRDVATERGSCGVTALDVAGALGLDARGARRTLQRLVDAGVVHHLGSVRSGTVGRPRRAYRVTLR